MNYHLEYQKIIHELIGALRMTEGPGLVGDVIATAEERLAGLQGGAMRELPALTYGELCYLLKGKKIRTIQKLRKRTGWGLTDAKALVDRYEKAIKESR